MVGRRRAPKLSSGQPSTNPRTSATISAHSTMLQAYNLCTKCCKTLPSFWLKTAELEVEEAEEEQELQAQQTSDTHTHTLAGSKISNKFLPKDKYLCPPTKRGQTKRN